MKSPATNDRQIHGGSVAQGPVGAHPVLTRAFKRFGSRHGHDDLFLLDIQDFGDLFKNVLILFGTRGFLSLIVDGLLGEFLTKLLNSCKSSYSALIGQVIRG